MSHKITLKGKATSNLRIHDDFLTFDMEEAGSERTLKQLPSSSTISYTIFVTESQLHKAGISNKEVIETPLIIQGEPSLDIPIDLCPGEVGVIVYQIQAPEKQAKRDTSKAKNHRTMPKGTQGWEDIQVLVVPEVFQKRPPNPQKVQEKKAYVLEHGALDEPVTVHQETKEIQDGYSRYVAAKELKWGKIPVHYVSK